MATKFTQITPYFFTTQSSAYAATNSGIIISEGQAALIDPGLVADEIAAIGTFVRDRGASTTMILLTHGHFDHVLGPEQLDDTTIVTHAAYARTVKAQERGLRRALDSWEAQRGIVRELPFSIPQPDRVFVRRQALIIGSQAFELLYSPGHHADQFVVYQDSSGLLWAADMLSDREIPFVEHNLRSYRRSLDRLAARTIRMLIPGHGTPTSEQSEIQARIAHDRQYLAELESRVARCLRAGLSVEQTLEQCAAMRFRNESDNIEAHRRNVESAYLELGGTGDAASVGWGQYY